MMVTIEKRGAIAIITINNPPVNALAHTVRSGLLEASEELANDDNIATIIIIGSGKKAFIGGADIREFGQPSRDPDLNTVINNIEAMNKPVIAAINGFALGGGLEVALACHYRIASPSSFVAIPEVKLGIIPGAGGTQRLPRVTSMTTAIDMGTSGRHVQAAEALKMGILDAIAEGDIIEEAINFAQGKAPRPTCKMATNSDSVDWEKITAQIKKKARGQHSPLAVLASLKNAAELSFFDGLAKEREIFTDCVTSEQSRGLRHAFFAERQVGKIPGLDADAKALPVKKAGIIGAGTMGGGIAMNFANAGIPITIIEREQEALDRGLAVCRKNYENTAAKGRITSNDVEQRMALLKGSTNMEDLSDCDLIIEAVFETMAVKKEVFGALDKIAKPGAVLATNTSTLDIDEIANTTNRPENVVGMHFFSPANVMRLLEVVRGSKSDATTIKTAMATGRAIGKVSVLAGNCDGFIGNRILHHYRRQAVNMLREGALPFEIDEAMRQFGIPMGIFQMGDLAGNDVGYLISQERKSKGMPAEAMEAVSEWLYKNNRHGQKTGKGWYLYEEGSRTPIRDNDVETKIKEVAATEGGGNQSFTDDQIMTRITHIMVNEGAKILEEDIAIRSCDIDQTYIHGYGYPAWRGGPMFYIDDVIGLDKALEQIKLFHNETGNDLWKPAPLLEKLVAEGKTFADYDKDVS